MVKPYKQSSESKKRQIAGMFNSIARRYDFLNHFLSFGIDRYWRRRAVKVLYKLNSKPEIILDAASGTGDMALAAMRLKPSKIFAVDISEDMLTIGKQKIKHKNLSDKIEFLEGDSENLIFVDNKFDAVIIAFGIRNFENLDTGLKEFHRVLKPGGVLVILEFSQPQNKVIRKLYNFYSTKILSPIGRAISGDEVAYEYLHESIEAFPSGEKLLNRLQQAGLKATKCLPLTFGIVSVYSANKNC